MLHQQDLFITYGGNNICLFSEGRDMYINLNHIVSQQRGHNKSIRTWLKNNKTLDFLAVWEKKHNSNFRPEGIENVKKRRSDTATSLAISYYIEETRAKGIFVKTGPNAGTYAHVDIAIRFAGWISAEIELFLVEKIQELKKVEDQRDSRDLLSHDQIRAIVKLKEIFKYVAHQEIIEDAHKDYYAAMSASQSPFAEFHGWRNKILGISKDEIDARIREYCDKKGIALTKKILSKPKREKILMFDSYEAVRHAVWDFLQITGEVNSLKIADLVRDIITIEQGEVKRRNEDTLFESKQDLGQYTDFEKQISDMHKIKNAREVLGYRKELKKLPSSGGTL